MECCHHLHDRHNPDDDSPENHDAFKLAEILINVNQNEPSWWVWVTDEMVPSNVEEWSGIDDENY
ncbi:hypothetical protein Gohar_024145, partial [Gossypium harknessii]|nr:hypothetical protein [Gossypium harknessii]